MPVRIGIDLGGTDLRAAALDDADRIVHHAQVATAAEAGPEAVLTQIGALVEEVSAGRAPIGIGIGSPGPLDVARGLVLHAPTLRGWRDVPLARLVAERTGLPTRLENDANAAALAEWRLGAGRGLRHMVYVTVSTGIGGGIIADGRLLHGDRSLAGEIGHMVVTEALAPCACGGFGCWEALASGTALGRRARAAGLMAEEPVTARLVAERAAAGDALASRLMTEEARYLGLGFANLLHLYAPELIVVGGGVSASLPLMAEEIGRIVAERAMPAYRSVPIRAAALGAQAGVIGAALLIPAG
ncbi:ROK family protein [Acidisoma sp. 7E03]